MTELTFMLVERLVVSEVGKEIAKPETTIKDII